MVSAPPAREPLSSGIARSAGAVGAANPMKTRRGSHLTTGQAGNASQIASVAEVRGYAGGGWPGMVSPSSFGNGFAFAPGPVHPPAQFQEALSRRSGNDARIHGWHEHRGRAAKRDRVGGGRLDRGAQGEMPKPGSDDQLRAAQQQTRRPAPSARVPPPPKLRRSPLRWAATPSGAHRTGSPPPKAPSPASAAACEIIVAEDFEKLADRPEGASCARLRSSGEERATEGTVKNPANYCSLLVE